MKDLRSLLQDGDPLAREGGLSQTDRERLRRHVLAESRREEAPARRGLFLAVAATLAVATVGGVVLTRSPLTRAPDAPSSGAVIEPEAATSLRQLQFSGPGGTRVIWTFNPNLQMR
jgi:hypothetical protein